MLCYKCEVWGLREANAKSILGVKLSTSSAYVYGELRVLRLISVLKCEPNRCISIVYKAPFRNDVKPL